ncbi:hypothetical protein N658DRAFT_250919 [Parathielavia hyrcaniae]|uniref:Uncharacterized protein n=1 Tax=Parathielavia hyrcaniae TaxID=113614 RepID=A0AAN6Q685_9PEZI|nr:hypothetical protein N658DRAFT_250919 [Parathielavia hyrcaniae]
MMRLCPTLISWLQSSPSMSLVALPSPLSVTWLGRGRGDESGYGPAAMHDEAQVNQRCSSLQLPLAQRRMHARKPSHAPVSSRAAEVGVPRGAVIQCLFLSTQCQRLSTHSALCLRLFVLARLSFLSSFVRARRAHISGLAKCINSWCFGFRCHVPGATDLAVLGMGTQPIRGCYSKVLVCTATVGSTTSPYLCRCPHPRDPSRGPLPSCVAL